MSLPPRRPGLLDEIAAGALEAEYRTLVAVPTKLSRPRSIIAIAVVGALFGLAGIQTAGTAAEINQERQGLLGQVKAAQSEQETLTARVQELSRDIAAARDAQLGQGQEADARRAALAALDIAAGTSTVTGPGLVVTLDDAADATNARGRVLEADLRQIVNGLWEAGAEAVALNGQRVTPTTAIRAAGDAITVNYRSLNRPYRLEAIGDPRTLPARFAATPGGSWLASLKANYGVQTSVNRNDALVLPGASEPALRHATRKGR